MKNQENEIINSNNRKWFNRNIKSPNNRTNSKLLLYHRNKSSKFNLYNPKTQKDINSKNRKKIFVSKENLLKNYKENILNNNNINRPITSNLRQKMFKNIHNSTTIKNYSAKNLTKDNNNSFNVSSKNRFATNIDNNIYHSSSSYRNKNQPINIEDLEAHPEWFELDNEATYTERPVDVQFKESLVNQTESLWINEPKKSELKTALKRFYDERTVDSKPLISDFSLKMDNDLLVLVSHSWQETKIDINKNEVVGLWNGIRFANLSDLLNVADLTNKILESQKWKVAVDYPPFQYKWPTSVLDNWVGKWWRWIYFNDAEWWSINFDTRVLSSGWWGIMGKIGSLWNHPEEYADYLSRRRIENNTVKIESTLYPMVKILSDSWIVFTREQEVKELEIWLKWIKEKLKVFKAYPSWNPFSIWTLSRKLEFKAINWDVQEFPENISDKFPTLTLVWNKEKFLKTINNPSNKMRWSVI